MRSLTLRIYLTVVLALALFALVSGVFVRRHLDEQRSRFEGAAQERFAAWGELLQRSLPGSDATTAEQAAALRDWADRLRLPLALDAADGQRIAASDSFMKREADRPPTPPGLGTRGRPPAGMHAIRLDDGRTLWVMRPQPLRERTGNGPPDGDLPHGPLVGGMPAGLLTTVPPPFPLLDTVSWKMPRVKVAVTVLAESIESVQVLVPAQEPLQPVKDDPTSGCAVSVTTVARS